MLKNLPPVVRNLMAANIVMWFVMTIAGRTDSPAVSAFLNSMALFPIDSGLFRIWQPFTYMFLHGGFAHLFFNMFTLWMFGRFIEYDLRSRRFLVYYIVCGIGAGLIQLLVCHLTGTMSVTVGASGAIYGLLLAFGMLHPNDIVMPLIPPIPMKAKWAVLIFAAIELFFGTLNFSWDNIAHFAHLGGAAVGFVMLWWWLRTKKIFRHR